MNEHLTDTHQQSETPWGTSDQRGRFIPNQGQGNAEEFKNNVYNRNNNSNQMSFEDRNFFNNTTPSIMKNQNQRNNIYKSSQEQTDQQDEMPPWLQAEKISFQERAEIFLYKVVTYIPVLITFGVIAFLFIYYTFCFLYPSIIGDFYGTLGITDMWQNQAELQASQTSTLFLAAFFFFCLVNLIISIIRTMRTPPGYIPEDTEWDLPPSEINETQQIIQAVSNTQQVNLQQNQEGQQPQQSTNILEIIQKSKQQRENQKQIQNQVLKNTIEEFTNEGILEDMEDPKQASHFDFRYIKSKTGPLYPVNLDNNEQQPLFIESTENKLKKLKVKSIERKQFGGVRMCQRCLRTKPDRCHHCSQCNKCILKMDHHCPWVANCIGFYNYKYFLNMLFYTSLTCLTIVCSSYSLVTTVLSREGLDYKISFYIVTSYVLASVFAFIITGFFFFHLWLIHKQYTTIEFCEKKGSDDLFKVKSPYDLGTYRNFQIIFGENPLEWFLPINPNIEGEGLFFHIRDDLLEQLANKTQKEKDKELQQKGEKKLQEAFGKYASQFQQQ